MNEERQDQTDIFSAIVVLCGVFLSQFFLHDNGDLRRVYHKPPRSEVASDPKFRREINPRTIGRKGRYKVVLVNGTAVRKVDPDFVAGGNPARYGYVPMDEVWVDDCTSQGDVTPYVVHEAVESDLMRRKGLSYDDAHAMATKAEMKIRRDPSRAGRAFQRG